jgi:hypothetical protein
MISIIFMLIILIYISAGLFVVIENIGLGDYPVTLYYHQGFYFTGKPLTTFFLNHFSYHNCNSGFW